MSRIRRRFHCDRDMPSSCVAANCTNKKSGDIQLHRFPKDHVQFANWTKFVSQKRAKWSLNDRSVICSDHFAEDCYDLSYDFKADFGLAPQRKRLVKNAVRTVNKQMKMRTCPLPVCPARYDSQPYRKRKRTEYFEKRERKRGVHLEEPSSPLQQQWSTSDLDEFVRQLTNPKHHISKVSSATPLMSPTSARESCVSATTTTTTMMSPQRITVDSNSDITDLSTDFNVKCNMKRSHFSWRKSPDDTSNSSSQSRFIFGRIRRTRQKSSEGDSSETTNMSVSSQGDDGIYDVSDAFSPKSPSSHEEHHVTFTCDSTPEGSDGETTSPKPQEEVPKKDSKKRRFRKMLTRPLRRSHSAGCAKDIPAHALFLQHQGDTEVESIESRRVKFLSTSESTDCERTRRPPRPIHKTSSADAAMMAAEDLPSFSFQSKAKSRGLAKNMKKKLQFLRRRHTDTSLGVTLRGENGKICHINSEDIIQWSKSFEALLADKHGLELFKGFLKSEFSEENIEFWIACEQFKTTKTSKLNSVAHKIYTDFVAVQAPKEINLDSKTRVKTLGNLASVNRFMFEDAQKRVQALMEKDSYPRFIQSEVYQRLLTTPSKS